MPLVVRTLLSRSSYSLLEDSESRSVTRSCRRSGLVTVLVGISAWYFLMRFQPLAEQTRPDASSEFDVLKRDSEHIGMLRFLSSSEEAL